MVEEQWYLLWPLAFAVLARSVRRERAQGAVLAAVVVVVMAGTAVAATVRWPRRQFFNPVRWQLQQVDTNNLLYLFSTFTRASGLLLGAAMAYRRRPWQGKSRSRAAAGCPMRWACWPSSCCWSPSSWVGCRRR